MTSESAGCSDAPGASPRRALPSRWLGAVGGALGTLALLPLAARLAERLATPPLLPGAERTLHDVKEATYAEVLVLLLAAPAAAFFFSVLLPRWLGRLAPMGRLSLEWPGAAFAASWFLARHGVRAKYALAIALGLTVVVAIGVVAFRRSFRVRRLFAVRARGDWLVLAAAAGAVALAVHARLPQRLTGGPNAVARVSLSTASLLVLAFALLARRRRPDAALAGLRMPAALVLSLASAALAVGQPRLAILAPTAAAVAATAAWAATRVARRDRATSAALGVFAAVCAWRLLVPASPALDIFEDGTSLAPVQLYLAGAAPYVGVSPVHGWGSDGGVDALWMRTFGPTLQTFQARRGLWSVLALFGLAAASFAAFRSGAWGALALLFALSICPTVIERQLLGFASLAFLIDGARREGSRWRFCAAGALAGLELLHSLDYGLVLGVGGALALAALAAVHRRDGRRSFLVGSLAPFAAGAVAATAPFLIRLAWLGSLGPFLRESFVETPRWVTEAWGFPAGSIWGALTGAEDTGEVAWALYGHGVLGLFPLCVLAAAAVLMLVRWTTRGLDEDDRGALAALVVAAVAMRVVLGRADKPHFERYAVFIAIPAAWLLLRAWRSRAGLALFVSAATILSLRLHPLGALEKAVETIEGSDRANAEPAASPPRAGRATLPATHAASYAAFRRSVDAVLAPGETFFDFDNQPGLYFLADRVPPIRYASVAQYESAERQREVIAALERLRPPLAILPEGAYGQLDIPNADRAPEVARYVDEHYGRPCRAANWILARRASFVGAGVRPDRADPKPCENARP